MVIGIDCSRAFVNARTGTENYSYNLVSAMLRLIKSSEHDFVLFVRSKAIIPQWMRECENVRVVTIKYRYLWTQIGLAMNTWRKFKIQNKKRMLDVLWVPAHTLPVLRNPRVRTVVTIHGLEYQWLPEYRSVLQRWYLPLSTIYAVSHADRLIAVSKFTASQLVEQLHTISKKIKVVYEGVGEMGGSNIEHRKKEKGEKYLRKWGVENKKYILFVGTLMPRKNLPALIEAFSLINGEYSEYKLVIAGGRGWMTEETFLAPGKYGVQESTVFTGRVSDLELISLYQGASLYVQPSITEGFGLPVLEAMQAGVPVVSSDGGALLEVVGEAGLIVLLNSEQRTMNSGNIFASELAKTMERVLSDAQLRAGLVRAGKKRVGELTWAKAARETLNVLLSC